MTAPSSSTRQRVLPPPCVRLLSRVEAAAYLSVSPNTFDRMKADGLMPQPKRVYRRLLWDVRDLDAAIDSLPREGESDDASGDDFNEWG